MLIAVLTAIISGAVGAVTAYLLSKYLGGDTRQDRSERASSSGATRTIVLWFERAILPGRNGALPVGALWFVVVAAASLGLIGLGLNLAASPSNHPPEAHDIHLAQQIACPGERITVWLDVSDPDGDPVTIV